jgi:hypothetical protein
MPIGALLEFDCHVQAKLLFQEFLVSDWLAIAPEGP